MAQRMRVSPATRSVLGSLPASGEPLWGLRMCELTGLPSGTVYPILERCERHGFLESEWEESDRRGARRRLYRLTPRGAELVIERGINEVARPQTKEAE